MMRVKSCSKLDPVTCFRAYCDPTTRLRYEKNLDKYVPAPMLGTNMSSAWQKTLRILTVAPRDLYTYNICNVMENGAIYLVIADIQEKPEESGNVRMRVPLGGVLFSPKEDGGSTIEYLVEGDLKGNIPQWATNKIFSVSSYGLVFLNDETPKYL